MTVRDFALPDLGEGLTESVLVAWRVGVGDTVELNQIIAEVETAKALVELPSPYAGVISKLYAEPGSTVEVGSPLVAFEVSDAATTDTPADTAARAPAAGPSAARVERERMLVGYGPPVEGGARPTRRARAAAVVSSGGAAEARAGEPARAAESRVALPASRLRSTPPVRTLARDLGVDLAQVAGTGELGLITRDDVRAFAAASGTAESGTAASGTAESGTAESGAAASAPPIDESPDRIGNRTTRTPIRGVRKQTAQAMVVSAFTAPHATEFLTVDVTPTMELIARLRESRAFAGLHLTVLSIVAKAVCLAVARTPSVNSRWDDAAQEIEHFHYVNLGIAAATPRGLMVPNIKDAERLDLAGLAIALAELVAAAKAGRSARSDLSGGTITITNIGVFGIDAGTPILNPGEAVILALGAVRRMPWDYRGQVALRQVMTLSLSFDHRLVDGEQAARFLTDVGAILADPGVVLTMV